MVEPNSSLGMGTNDRDRGVLKPAGWLRCAQRKRCHAVHPAAGGRHLFPSHCRYRQPAERVHPRGSAESGRLAAVFAAVVDRDPRLTPKRREPGAPAPAHTTDPTLSPKEGDKDGHPPRLEVDAEAELGAVQRLADVEVSQQLVVVRQADVQHAVAEGDAEVFGELPVGGPDRGEVDVRANPEASTLDVDLGGPFLGKLAVPENS